ncbi:LysR family transcriptional regulator [Congzhengia sp.]|uniref:LysR family transcriptional regulator n=1 Tax=Congzhengia sp. TaxID=2944168 RepID=UPI003077AF79
MIETRHLYYFLAVAREQNITRAADTLHITQPTLSKQLMDLEHQLGKQLFIRGKRTVTLTEEGTYLRSKAQEMIDLMEKTEAAFHEESKTVSGDIHLGCGETRVMEYITDVFKQIHLEYPKIHFHIYSADADNVLEKLDKGLLDIGLLLGPLRREKYDYIDIHQKDTYGLLMPKNCTLASQSAITVEQMKDLPLIFSQQAFLGHQELEWFGVDYSALNVVATYNLIFNATFMVEKGIGYALCLDNLVNIDGNRKLTFRPITPELSIKSYIVMKKYQAFSPPVKIFMNKIKNIL